MDRKRRREEIDLFDKDLVSALLARHVGQAGSLTKRIMKSLGRFYINDMGLKVEWGNLGRSSRW